MNSRNNKFFKYKNILGGRLVACCHAPKTGFHRDGFCRADSSDLGMHVVCAQMTTAFLKFTRKRGNDLSTPRPEFGFPGLKPGDRWCLCAMRWQEAWDYGVVPPVVLAACDESALEVLSLESLVQNKIDSTD